MLEGTVGIAVTCVNWGNCILFKEFCGRQCLWLNGRRKRNVTGIDVQDERVTGWIGKDIDGHKGRL